MQSLNALNFLRRCRIPVKLRVGEKLIMTIEQNATNYADMRHRIKAIMVGSIGNLVEWYDFYAYAAFQLYFASSFFPSGDPVVENLKTSTLFAVTFLMRPIGGWLFGQLADRYGRRTSMTISVLMMCFGSLMIAVTPTYATIGFGAAIVLALARIIQGLSLGGEYGASAAYVAEVAEPGKRGFYSSFLYVTLIGGQLCALIVLLALQQVFLTPDQLKTWGWRIPFVIGALLSIVAAYMRRNMHESEAFTAAKAQKATRPSPFAFLNYPKETLLVIGMTMGGTAAFYTYTTYMQKFLKLSVGLSDIETTLVSGASLIFAMFLQPIYGAISDKIGRKKLLIGFGIAGVLFTIPLLTALQGTKSALVAFLLIAAAWLIVSGYTSINAVVKAELFPTSVRATGIAVPYALAVSIFGGTAEPLALQWKAAGHEEYFYYYLTACIAISLVVYLLMRDTKTHSAIERHV